MLEIKADFLVTSTKTAKLDFGLPYHEFKICSLEPSLPDPDTAPLTIIIGSLSNDDGNVNENVAKQWIKLQSTITARGNATTWPRFRRRL